MLFAQGLVTGCDGRHRISLALCATVFLLIASLSGLQVAHAQSYPSKPIRIIVNMAPGGGVDVLGRIVAQGLTETTGQTVVVENRPGAGGALGADYVAKSAPDGYTLLVTNGGTLHTIPHLVKKIPFDPLRDLASITEIALIPNILIVRKSLPVDNVADFVKYVKSNPGKVTFGSSGTGSSAHISGEMLNFFLGASAVHVPYKGLSAVYPDMIGDRIDFMFDGGAGLPYVSDGTIKLLAQTSEKRMSLLPDTPTMIEGGVPGFVLDSMHSVMVPANTPKDVVEALNRYIVTYLKKPDITQKIRSLRMEVLASSPETAAANLQRDYVRHGDLLKKIGLQPN